MVKINSTTEIILTCATDSDLYVSLWVYGMGLEKSLSILRSTLDLVFFASLVSAKQRHWLPAEKMTRCMRLMNSMFYLFHFQHRLDGINCSCGFCKNMRTSPEPIYWKCTQNCYLNAYIWFKSHSAVVKSAIQLFPHLSIYLSIFIILVWPLTRRE